MVQARLFLGVLAFAATFSIIAGSCQEEGCDNPNANLYESLGCEPVYDNSSACCPRAYDCEAIFGTPQDKCHFQGRVYRKSEAIPDGLSRINCKVGCQCFETETSGRYGFQCAILDCSEHVGRPISEACRYKYSLDDCCAVEKACPPFDGLAKCEFGGETYLEGERFWPEKCTACVCSDGFRGEIEEPHCRKRKCGDEIRFSGEIEAFYAPFYVAGGGDCCPAGWLRPEDNEIAAEEENAEGIRSSCKFGSKYYEIGAKFEYKVDGRFECGCDVPPFVSCRIVVDYVKY